jgi:hypothetical protein
MMPSPVAKVAKVTIISLSLRQEIESAREIGHAIEFR